MVLLAAVVAATNGAETEKAVFEEPEGATRLDPKHGVWVDVAGSRVAVEGRVCLREGVLEMFACPAGTKEHESVVAVEAPAFLLHTALLAAGAEPGKPARFEPEFLPPEGPRIGVDVEWLDEAGQAKRVRAQHWILDVDTGGEMTLPFVFAGSGFWTDPDTGRQRYLAESGDLICVSNFGTAMLDVPAASTQANADLLFEPFTERIPPLDTPVRLWLTVESGPPAGKAAAAEPGVNAAIESLLSADNSSGSTASLREAWDRVAASDSGELLAAVRAIGDGSPTASNWLRTAVDSASQRLADADALPVAALRDMVTGGQGSPKARRVAYEILVANDPAAKSLLDGLLNDASLELRYDAVAALLARADSVEAADREALLREALAAARALPQIEAAAAALKDLGVEVGLADTLGFVLDWRLVGPFDNRGGIGFATEYPPEQSLDMSESFDGMPGADSEESTQVGWRPYRTRDRLGEVDLNTAVGPNKGAVAYAWATVVSDEPRDVQIRYSSRNATKLWVNGEPLAANEVYHDGAGFDQYRVDAALAAGENAVLLKTCQNEQTEPWAQLWNFQLRVCDALGGKVAGVTVARVEETAE